MKWIWIPKKVKRKRNGRLKRPALKLRAPKLKALPGKIKKVKVPKILAKSEPESRLQTAIENLPRITNETVAEHREELLSKSRKYIYPLKHTKHRVVVVSASLVVAAVVIFFAYVGLALYRFQSSSTFLYYVTQVLPFPIAKAGPSFVSYQSYLFELRHYEHYYETQQQVNFDSTSGKQQLAAFKKQALQQVIDDAYVKQLATQYHVNVSGSDVDSEVTLLRQQNRLGSSDQQFADVLKAFWGWSVGDFKHELSSQLLAQKVVSTLDTGTHARAQAALAKLKHRANFAKLAKQVSDDNTTKAGGGVYPFQIDQTTQNLPPQVVNELFSLRPGQISGIINTGYTLEIVKVISHQNGKIQAAHIALNFRSINTYINPLKVQKKPHVLIKLQ